MSYSMTKNLILKDWHFNRTPIFLLSCLGLISLFLFSIDSESTFYVGLVLLVSVVTIIGVLLVISTVVEERKNKTLTFIMSLPITYMDYTKAKIIVNLTVFVIAWLVLFVGAIGVVYFYQHLPNGLIPITVIILIELFVAYIMMLATALISESEAWTIVVMTINNIGISLFMFWVGSFSGIGDHMMGDVAVWNSTAITMVTAECAIIVLLLAMTFYFQSRKTDFL